MTYESWANWTNFLSSWENRDFFWVKSVVPYSTLKMRKSKKHLAYMYAHTHTRRCKLNRVKIWENKWVQQKRNVEINICQGSNNYTASADLINETNESKICSPLATAIIPLKGKLAQREASLSFQLWRIGNSNILFLSFSFLILFILSNQTFS